MSDVNGELPPGWLVTNLGAVTEPSKAKVEPNEFAGASYIGLEHIESGSNRIIGAGDASQVKSTKSVFRRGDILFGKLRPYLRKVCRPDFDGVCSTDILVFPESTVTDNGYLLHFLSQPSTADFATQNASGINLPRISFNTLSDLDFPLPPLAEQRRIVAKIEALQERSRKARAALEEVGPLLEQFRQSLLAAAFRGDLTADWRAAHPDVEPASELLARIRKERREKWEQAELAKYEAKGTTPPKGWQKKYKEPEPVDDSDLPELPVGWCWARWEEIGFCQNGRAFPSIHYSDKGTRLLRPGNLHISGKVEWNDSNSRFMPAEWELAHSTYTVGENELVMNLTAQSLKDEFLGRVCLTDPGEHCLLNQRIARITPVAPNAVNHFRKCWR